MDLGCGPLVELVGAVLEILGHYLEGVDEDVVEVGVEGLGIYVIGWSTCLVDAPQSEADDCVLEDRL